MKFLLLLFSCTIFLYPLTLSAQDAQDYLDLAVVFKESGEYQKAQGIIQEIGDIKDNKDATRYLARLKFLSGDSESALNLIKNIQPKDWLDFLYLGLIYEDLGNYSKATKYYLASRCLRKNSIASFRLGKIYRAKKNHEKAIEFFSEVIDLDSSIRLAYYYLGESFYKRSQYKQAYKFLSKAINFYPKSKLVRNQMQLVRKALGDDFFTRKKSEKEKQRKKVKLSFYRPEQDMPYVRIGLGKDLREFSFSCGSKFLVRDGKNSYRGDANRFYTIVLQKGEIVLKDYQGNEVFARFKGENCNISSLGKGKNQAPFYILDLVYGKGNFWHKKVDRIYRGGLEVFNKLNKIMLINILSIEEYLYGVLAAEIPAKSHPQALRAQAVAARTLVMKNSGRHKKEGFDFCADVHCQVYQGMSAETPYTNQAVDDTRGQFLKFDTEPIETFYHANCGGCLVSDLFGKRPYLLNSIDANRGTLPDSAYSEEEWFFTEPNTFCSHNSLGKFRWQRVYDEEDFLLAFDYEIVDLISILPKEKGECFHYKKIEVMKVKEKISLETGLKIRDYFDKLRSSAFKIEIKSSSQNTPEMLFIWGAGFGHGVGMCQEGAIQMAEEDYSYKEILKHYYPGAKLENAYLLLSPKR